MALLHVPYNLGEAQGQAKGGNRWVLQAEGREGGKRGLGRVPGSHGSKAGVGEEPCWDAGQGPPSFSADPNVCASFPNRATAKPVLVLLPVLGLTWVCGVLVHLSIIWAYVFIGLNSLQVSRLPGSQQAETPGLGHARRWIMWAGKAYLGN